LGLGKKEVEAIPPLFNFMNGEIKEDNFYAGGLHILVVLLQ
jgi:hypothetical protein